MCNACGFFCCAYDGFSGCGCENCPYPACWPDDEEELDDDDGFQERLKEYLGEWSTSKGDFEYYLQCYIADWLKRKSDETREARGSCE